MLIWIRVPSAAIGVFAIFVLLLATAVSEETLATTTLEEAMTNISTSDFRETQNLRVSDLPFVNSLLNPCSSGSPSTIRLRPQTSLRNLTKNIYNSLALNANYYKKGAQDVLDKNFIRGCSTLDIPNLPNTPSLQELQAMNNADALRRLYSSLLTHAAYAYFIHHQYDTSAIRCSERIDDERSLAEHSRNLASSLTRHLACITRIGITVIGYDQDDTNSFLNETLTDLSVCSRRALRDCQVIKSIVHFLAVVSDYSSGFSMTSPQTEHFND